MRASGFMQLAVLAVVATGALPATASAQSPDAKVSVAGPPTPYLPNGVNEPALAIDANHPAVLAAGANDLVDSAPCNGSSCDLTPDIGISGVYFSLNGGGSWVQPTYPHGLTAQTGTTHVGPIHTLPNYFENGMSSHGDPAVAFGPRPGANGRFSWGNGSRLYYANLTSNVGATRSEQAFRGFEAIAVSRTDDPQTASAGGPAGKAAWKPPVIISRQSSTTFSDKEQIWADNASSSPFFGTVYVCWAAFVGQEKGNAAPAPLEVAVSHDGGSTWKQHPISSAANNSQRNPLDGCTIRTDSRGTAYVFGVGTSVTGGRQPFEFMARSTNGGANWSQPQPVAGPVSQPGAFDPVQGRPVIDGVAGARSDLAPAPSVDIANGAPTGEDATDRIVMSYVSGPLATPHVYFTESTNRGASWLAPRAIERAGDRGFYAAPAISPNGTDVYVVYNAFTTPYQPTTATPRSLVGVVLHADTGGSAPTGAFTELHRSPPGDPRGSSQNNLVGEFLGDYVYAAASRTYGAAVWNDVRNAADCPAIDAYRQALADGQNATAPAPEQECPATFGNSDIFGGTYPDPTP